MSNRGNVSRRFAGLPAEVADVGEQIRTAWTVGFLGGLCDRIGNPFAQGFQKKFILAVVQVLERGCRYFGQGGHVAHDHAIVAVPGDEVAGRLGDACPTLLLVGC